MMLLSPFSKLQEYYWLQMFDLIYHTLVEQEFQLAPLIALGDSYQVPWTKIHLTFLVFQNRLCISNQFSHRYSIVSYI